MLGIRQKTFLRQSQNSLSTTFSCHHLLKLLNTLVSEFSSNFRSVASLHLGQIKKWLYFCVGQQISGSASLLAPPQLWDFANPPCPSHLFSPAFHQPTVEGDRLSPIFQSCKPTKPTKRLLPPCCKLRRSTLPLGSNGRDSCELTAKTEELWIWWLWQKQRNDSVCNLSTSDQWGLTSWNSPKRQHQSTIKP